MSDLYTDAYISSSLVEDYNNLDKRKVIQFQNWLYNKKNDEFPIDEIYNIWKDIFSLKDIQAILKYLMSTNTKVRVYKRFNNYVVY